MSSTVSPSWPSDTLQAANNIEVAAQMRLVATLTPVPQLGCEWLPNRMPAVGVGAAGSALSPALESPAVGGSTSDGLGRGGSGRLPPPPRNFGIGSALGELDGGGRQ